MEVKDLCDDFLWQQEQVLMLSVFIFIKRAVMTESKTRCLCISGMMQSEAFRMLDGLTRHDSEVGFLRQN